MNRTAVVAIGVGVVAGIVGAVYLKRFLDRELPEVLPDNEVTRRLDEDMEKYRSWRRRERPQRHEEEEAETSG